MTLGIHPVTVAFWGMANEGICLSECAEIVHERMRRWQARRIVDNLGGQTAVFMEGAPQAHQHFFPWEADPSPPHLFLNLREKLRIDDGFQRIVAPDPFVLRVMHALLLEMTRLSVKDEISNIDFIIVSVVN